jgi:hypothetical protein
MIPFYHTHFFRFLSFCVPAAVLVMLLYAFAPMRALSQTDEEIDVELKRFAAGQRDEVNVKLRRWLKTNPDRPGLLFLQGISTDNAEDAVHFYQKIIQKYPGSAWADDALHRLEQYSYAIGAYNTAEKYHAKLVAKYPRSPFISTGKTLSGDGGVKADATAYTLEIGAFITEKEAKATLTLLKKAGYSVELHAVARGKRKAYSLWLGSFPSQKSATHMMKNLKKQQNISSIIVERQ